MTSVSQFNLIVNDFILPARSPLVVYSLSLITLLCYSAQTYFKWALPIWLAQHPQVLADFPYFTFSGGTVLDVLRRHCLRRTHIISLCVATFRPQTRVRCGLFALIALPYRQHLGFRSELHNLLIPLFPSLSFAHGNLTVMSIRLTVCPTRILVMNCGIIKVSRSTSCPVPYHLCPCFHFTVTLCPLVCLSFSFWRPPTRCLRRSTQRRYHQGLPKGT